MSWNPGQQQPPFAFPTPGGFQPPSGPPPSSNGYPPPPGPPPQPYYGAPSWPPAGPPPSDRGYPGQAYHQQHQYASPPGAPPSQGYYNSPSYPPPGGPPQGSGYFPPPGGPPQFSSYGPPGGSPQPYPSQPHMPPSQPQSWGSPGGQPYQQPQFQYSQCTGKKKALCIGINYRGLKGELRGCINDANNIAQFLCRQYGYKMEDIVMLTDDSTDQRKRPTRANIMAAMRWLVNGAATNDALFFHYSGHGGQTKDTDGDEADGYDEVIYPLDHETAGHIVDDEMHDIMVKPLPPGCRLTAIFDSCHSGSAMDLPYIYSTEGKVKEPNLAKEAGKTAMSAVSSYAKGDMAGVLKGVMGLAKTAAGGGQKADKKAKATRTSPADVISWSGCKDSQTSADTTEAGQATGAMSFAFRQSLSTNPQQTYQQLLTSMREILRAKYSQKPQLSSSHPMDTSIYFLC